MKVKWHVGVDEAGRGPLAGPVAVGVVKVASNFNWNELPGVTDSKALSEKERNRIFLAAKELRHRGLLDFAVAQVGPSVIDSKGITYAIRLAQQRCLHRLELDHRCTLVRLDGGLRAPAEFKQQATIIKGDALYPEIGLASIVAKETRDTYMRRIARRFGAYELEVHKGYGTKRHRELIKQRGLSPIHRVTYCKNIIPR